VVLEGFFFVLWEFLRGVLKKWCAERGGFVAKVWGNAWQNVDKKLFFAAVERWDTIFNFIL
jgi:hypothetical protein